MLKRIRDEGGLTAWGHKQDGLELIVTKAGEELHIGFNNMLTLHVRIADGRVDFLKGCPRDFLNSLLSLCEGHDDAYLSGFTPHED